MIYTLNDHKHLKITEKSPQQFKTGNEHRFMRRCYESINDISQAFGQYKISKAIRSA